MAKKQKYYVVWKGHEPGIYNTWLDCQKQIKNFPGASFKSFKTKEEAEFAFGEHPDDIIGKSSKIQKLDISLNKDIIHKSISVDAACSGNPGIMEYRGVNTLSREELFIQGPFQDATNNVGEFLALVHGLGMLMKNNDKETVIYSDSKTAMAWVRNKKVKTTLKKTTKNEIVFSLINRALHWLNSNKYQTKILKWDTKNWGEIPADFGRK